MQVRRAGDRAVLIELGDVSAEELHAAAREKSSEGVVIIGHSSLLVVSLGFPLSPQAGRGARAEGPREHEFPVLFEREPHEVTLKARYLGFRAGFAYLEGWPRELAMPRLDTSRPVRKGSFAIAGTMAGFYPIDTPGGWNVLGRTSVTLWDPNREPPNLIAPGDVVHVKPVSVLPPEAALSPPPPPSGEPIAEVISPGQLTRIVGPRDWSRAQHGVAPGGPFDALAAAEANRAAGNGDAAPLLECVLVGPDLRFLRPARVGVFDGVRAESQVVDQLSVGRLRGFRGYVAVEGGFSAGGRYDENRLRRGETLFAGSDSGGTTGALASRLGGEAERRSRHEIAVVPGPHEPSISDIECEVTPQLDRVGIRLRPLRPLGIEPPRDLPSCGMQFGSIQLHPDGSLVAMGPDHPVTGGYLQPMTVMSSDLWKLARLSPGECVRFYSP